MATNLTIGTTAPARRLALGWEAAMAMAATEYNRVAALLDQLEPARWVAATDCPAWDVRAMAGHMLGMMQMVATEAEMERQQAASHEAASRSGTSALDALTALQVEQNAHLDTAGLVRQVRTLAPQAASSRRHTPAEVRDSTMAELQDVGGSPEPWTFGYLLGIILTRDPFMHRIDIARATGVPLPLEPRHEGVLVDDVVQEWAGRHGRPFSLELTGVAGGHWGNSGGEHIEMDALEFCRTLSGRQEGNGLLSVRVPF
jgi:uncharacterized protein (TIGR03083 family)